MTWKPVSFEEYSRLLNMTRGPERELLKSRNFATMYGQGNNEDKTFYVPGDDTVSKAEDDKIEAMMAADAARRQGENLKAGRPIWDDGPGTDGHKTEIQRKADKYEEMREQMTAKLPTMLPDAELKAANRRRRKEYSINFARKCLERADALKLPSSKRHQFALDYYIGAASALAICPSEDAQDFSPMLVNQITMFISPQGYRAVVSLANEKLDAPVPIIHPEPSGEQ